MSEELWERAREIVGEALELHGKARRQFLDKACAGEPELRAEVDRILAHEDTADPDFLVPPAETAGIAPPPDTLGEFQLGDELGRGGMGVVYRARQPRLNRDVAIKVLSVTPATAGRDVERFHREARAIASLRHAGIIQVFADGQLGDTHWFAMELVEGRDLHAELKLQRRAATSPGDQPFLPRPGEPEHASAIARLCADVADALHYAHENGLVHRDVKPQNLLLQPDGRVQIGDFGLVRDRSMGSITRTGDVAGTPHYMSPEQARVRRVEVDHRTDVYSLGVVLYELATLHRPFEGRTSADVITKIREADPRMLRAWNNDVPRDLQAICLKAMAKEPRERYATAAELRDDLRRFLAGEPVTAKSPTIVGRARRWIVRRRVRVVAGALTVAGVALGATLAARIAEARTLGTVTVEASDAEGVPVRGRVEARRIDPILGVTNATLELGRLPLREAAIEPGYYRIVVYAADWSPRVFARVVEARDEVVIDAVYASHQQSLEGMVFVEGGTLALRDEAPTLMMINGEDLPIEAFWLDDTEVTNADYRAFVEATGHAPPPHWDSLVDADDDKPIVNVSWYDARAYAEWAGKHLPSFPEWTWAARGAENRVYPWAGAVMGEVRGNALHPRLGETDMPMEEQYNRFVDPVASHPDARTPSLLHDMFGNVGEFTETPPAESGEDGPYSRWSDRIAAGHAWDAGTVGNSLKTFYWLGTEQSSAGFRTGFRCARAAE